jgi:hypothetical protein
MTSEDAHYMRHCLALGEQALAQGEVPVGAGGGASGPDPGRGSRSDTGLCAIPSRTRRSARSKRPAPPNM